MRPVDPTPPTTTTRLSLAPHAWDDWRLLVDSVVDYAIYMLDPDGRIVSWNLGAEHLHGYTAQEIIGQHFSQLYLPEDIAADMPTRTLEQTREHGRSEEEGWRLRQDGTRLWANIVTTALRQPDGELRGFGKVTRDLTRTHVAAEELQQSEERFHHLVDAVTDYAIFMLDEHGHIMTWNSGAERIKGYKAHEVIGKHFSLFYAPLDRSLNTPEAILSEVREHGRYEGQGFRVRKDGSLFWANVIVTPLRDTLGRLAGYAKITRDLSDHRASAEALRRAEERFRLLVESIADYAIYMLDAQGRVTTWNRGAERMKGYRAEQIIGQDFAVFFTKEDALLGKPARELSIARAEGRYADEGWRVRRDGTTFWASIVVTAISDAQGNPIGFAKITRDLTQRRQAEEIERRLIREQAAHEAAQQLVKRSEEANRIKDEFLATVSHELRTPLNAIVGWAAILHQQLEGSDAGNPREAGIAKAAAVIDRNAKAQAKIIDDILDVSRIVTGKLKIDPKVCDLVAITNAAIEVIRPSAVARQLTVSFDISQLGAPDCWIVGDAERLQQVVWNLLSNAVKFTTDTGTIQIALLRHDRSVSLTVRDTGRGIEPEFLPFMFQRFRQADATTTRRIGGLGLGLALVRHIVELHGGSVAVESSGVGNGSLFSVTLPVRAVIPALPPSPVGPTRETVSAAPLPTVLQGVRVLVVEDDDDARELLAVVLSRAGASVESASSATEGFHAVTRFHPHVLVSDIAMPDEDGYSFVRRVRALAAAEGGDVSALALTAYTRSEDRSKALAAGFTAHIGKPVNPDDLVSTVANLAALART